MRFSRLIRFTAVVSISVLSINNLAFAAKRPVDPAAMKAKIQARGVGQGVRITLADKTGLKGMILSIGETSFTIKPRDAAPLRQIEYSQITGVHRDKLSRGQRVGIAVAIAATGLAITVVVIKIKLDHSFSKLTF